MTATVLPFVPRPKQPAESLAQFQARFKPFRDAVEAMERQATQQPTR